MQAALYLTATRGLGAPEARICYDHAEPLCHSLARPHLLYVALIGRCRYSLVTDKLSATMRIAKRVYSLAQEQNDSTLMIGTYRALAVTLYYLGDFMSARQYAMRGVQIWRSAALESPVGEVSAPAVVCMGVQAPSWPAQSISINALSMRRGHSKGERTGKQSLLASRERLCAIRAPASHCDLVRPLHLGS